MFFTFLDHLFPLQHVLMFPSSCLFISVQRVLQSFRTLHLDTRKFTRKFNTQENLQNYEKTPDNITNSKNITTISGGWRIWTDLCRACAITISWLRIFSDDKDCKKKKKLKLVLSLYCACGHYKITNKLRNTVQQPSWLVAPTNHLKTRSIHYFLLLINT